MKTKKQVRELLENLSLPEKAAQLIQLTGNFFEGSGIETGPSMGVELPPEMVRHAGSILNVTGAETLRKVQENYLKNSKNKIPLLFMADVINGYRTVFPIPLAQGCSFNPELVKAGAKASARESAAAGLHVTFSPMADLCRDSRWGRVMESTGEDVWLNRRMVRAMVEGYQGDSLDTPQTVAACVKHFAAYGAPEAGREYNSVDMSEKKLLEEYLPAYKEAVEAGCALVMTSFNTLNGIPATANKWLNREILREQWGFDGVLISDYAAIHELMEHGVAETEDQAAELGIRAGVDMDMVSPAYGNHLVKLVEEGFIPEEMVDECVLHILELKNRLGLLDNPFRFDQETMDREQACLGCKEHKELAKSLAGESMVLLKNEGILPISERSSGKKIALIGPFADSRLLCGSWSMFYQEEEVVTLQQGMEEVFGVDRLLTAEGSFLLEKEEEFLPFKGQPITGREERERSGKTDEELLREAVGLASEADVVILTLGEHPQQSGEGGARTNLCLPGCQRKLLKEICKVNQKVAVLLFSGRPLAIPEVEEKAQAILQVWFPGTEGGSAMADILSGRMVPSGRLAMSFPWCVGQEPLAYSRLSTGRPVRPDQPNRFSSGYIDAPDRPLYPFGFGLSYTAFSYRDVRLDKKEFGKGEDFCVKGTVKNTGEYPGAETVLCFVQDVCGSTARPERELKGFEKIFLRQEEEVEFSITIKEEELRFITAEGVFETEPGIYRVFAGGETLEIRRKE